MATRTLSSSRDRVLTILLLPFMSCGAKVPIYILFVSAFFPDHTFLVMLCLYVMGIVCAVAIASLLKATSFKGEPVPFVMELPNYRLPAFKSTVQLMWEKAKDFLQKAFSVILIASIVIWFLQSYDIMLNPVDSSENSILALIGQSLAPFFAPLGLNDWRIPTALITGFMAKETVVSTLAVLIQDGSLATLFTPVTAISFLVFSLIYTPCIAAVATAYKEFRKTAVSYLVFQTLLAWILAFIAYTILA
jgi:ferrous iron transport protein B